MSIVNNPGIDCTRCRRELKDRGEEVVRRVREQSAAKAQAAREKVAREEAAKQKAWSAGVIQEQDLEPRSGPVATVEGSGS